MTHYEPGRGKTFPLSALGWTQLATALDALEPTAERKVDAGCLAFELDARADGVERLMRVQADAAAQAKPGLPDRLRRLLELAAAEQ